MKKLLLPLALLFAANADADDRLREVQSALKDQGFYYGEINGESSAETTAAIRRYQIRSGLEVTGSLSDETVKSLSGGTAPSEPLEAPAATPKPKPPIEETDRKFLKREEARQQVPPPPVPRRPATTPDDGPGAPAPEFENIFAQTPYAFAPREVQASTFHRAQGLLASRGLYRGGGGPAMEEALLAYQRSSRLPLTGRLDLETLSSMHLLPGRASVPLKGFLPPGEGRPVYRGVWVR